jgi:NitT/TauT family transport system substrate-binding protein
MHFLKKGLALALLSASVAAAADDKVSLITDFGFNGRHAYFYVAIDKGHYKAAGLDVTILRGQGSVDAIRQVGAGNATFGFADAGSLVLSRANGKIPVKLVSVVYARPPQAIFCRADAGLRKPQDLEGRSIANPAGGSIPDMFPAYAKAAGIDAAKVRWVVANSDMLPSLLATGRAPCVGQFIVGEPLLRALAKPAELIRFAYGDAGLSYYGNGIIATDATIKTQPELVRRFVAATIRGMKDAFADPAEAGRIMNKYQRQVSPEIARDETVSVAELATIKGRPLGMIDAKGIDATLAMVNAAFKLDSPVKPEDVYAPGFVAE